MGFFNLAALAWLGSVGILVLIYFFNRRQDATTIPSLLPFEELPEEPVRTRLLQVDLLFVLQLLVLLLLVGTLARPYVAAWWVGRAGEHVAVVVDVSASMQASSDAGGRRGHTRFEEAREQARQAVRALRPQDAVMVVAAGVRPQVMTAFTRETDVAVAAIERLQPTAAPGRLGAAVAVARAALQRKPRGRVVVVTDQEAPPGPLGNLRVFPVGAPLGNVAITSLATYGTFLGGGAAREVYVSVANYDAVPRTVPLAVTLDERGVDARTVPLQPGETRTVRFEQVAGHGILTVRLAQPDGFEVDNGASAVLVPRAPLRLLLVTEDTALQRNLEDLAKAAAQLTLTLVTPAAYDPAAVAGQDIVLLHRFTPPAWPEAATWMVAPPEGGLLQTAGARPVPMTVLDWDPHHPVTRYVQDLADLRFAQVQPLAVPGWASVAVRGRTAAGDVPLLFSGEHLGHRRVIWACEVPAERWSARTDLRPIILALNTLQWLAPQGAAMVRAGEAYRLPVGERRGLVRVTDPRGLTTEVAATGHAPVFADTTTVGLHTVAVAGMQTRFVVNLFDERESDLRRPQVATDLAQLEDAAGRAGETPTPPEEIGRWLLWLALALFLVEWVISFRRARRQAV